MNERVRGQRGKIEKINITPVVQTGLPNGMSMAREETGTWTIRDSRGQVRGLGRDPQGAIFAVFKVAEVNSVLRGWNNYQQAIKEGGEIDLK